MKTPPHLATDLALVAAIAAAVCAQPPALVPWPWLAGYAVPGVLLHTGQRLLPRRKIAVVLIAALTLLAASTGLRALAPASRAAPIACILVTPLAYFALRRAPGDRSYALFLSLCLLAIGSVLDSERARWCGAAFAVGSAFVLARESAGALGANHRPRSGSPGVVRRAAHAAAVTSLSALTAASLFQILTIAPVPDRHLDATPQPASDPRAPRVQGLSTQFDLSASDGWLDTVRDLQASILAVVRREDAPPPDNLYLRFVHFDLAGANRWATGKFVAYPQADADGWTLFTPEAGAARATYSIERQPVANGHLLLPEGTFAVQGIGNLEGHSDLGLLRERVPSDEASTYRVQALVADARPARVDLRAMHLLSLPEALLIGDVARLAQRYVRGAGDDPMQRALALAHGLRRDYRYTRRDPTGPSPDVLHNFLFHAKAGYCMHFASALAVMLRSLRIPCRIGAGLFGGRLDERTGARVFGAADAHAWVEVPCVGRGWVVLDATPEATRAARARDRETTAPDVAGDLQATDALGGSGPAPAWLLAVLFLVALVSAPLLRRPTDVARERSLASLPAVHPARVLLARVLSQLAALGATRHRHETLAALAARAAARLELDRSALADAFAAYEEVRFGGRGWDRERAARMQRGFEAVASARKPTA